MKEMPGFRWSDYKNEVIEQAPTVIAWKISLQSDDGYRQVKYFV